MVMSVNPGASGQRFIESALPKVARLRQLIDENGYAPKSRSTAASRRTPLRAAPPPVPTSSSPPPPSSTTAVRSAENIAGLRESLLGEAWKLTALS